MIVLKQLSDALKDNDAILAVIRGSAINQDGRSYGLTAPNGTAQQTLIRLALANANLEPTEIGYVEAHGTGTPLGDPIEVQAIGQALGEGRSHETPLWIGSVKSNIGHLEAAAGVAGLMKVILSLQHGAIPGTLHFKRPNPQIPWEQLPIRVPTTLQEWPAYQSKRRAGVSAFGFSGTNAHLILEEAPPHEAKREKLPPTTWRRQRCWVAAPASPLLANISGGNGGERVGDTANGLHPLLGKRLYSPLIEGVCFEAQISVSRTPWISDHQVQGQIVMPATGYVDIALTAARSVFKTNQVTLQDVFYQEPFVLNEDDSKALQCIIRNTASSTPAFEIVSLNEKRQVAEDEVVWRTHVSGIIRLNGMKRGEEATGASQLKEIRSRCQQEESAEEVYRWLHHRGYYFGAAHQGINKIWRSFDTIVGEVELPEQLLAEFEHYTFHPALLDACSQVLLPLLPEIPPDQIFITIGKDEVHFYNKPTSRLWVHAKRSGLDGRDNAEQFTIKGDIAIYTPQGEKVAEVLGYLMKRSTRISLKLPAAARSQVQDWLYEIEWQSAGFQSSLDVGANGFWVILADQTGVADSLLQELSVRRNLCLQVWLGEKFEQVAHLTYRVNPRQPADFQRLLQEVYQIEQRLGTPLQGVVHLWSLEQSTGPIRSETLNLSQEVGVGTVLHLVQALDKYTLAPEFRLLLVTKGAQAISNGEGLRRKDLALSPAHSSLWGLARVIELEHPELHTRVVDLDPASTELDYAALLRELYGQDRENLIALRQAQRLVPRLVPIKEKVEPDSDRLVLTKEGMSLQLTIPQKGTLDHLTWQSVPRQKPAPDEVEIRVRATALNFVDVLDALGMVPFEKGGFGLDCAGEIVAIGEGVTRFKVGDPVIALAPGCFSQYITVKAIFVALKPTRLTFEEAATIPVVFLTAYYALYEQAKIKAGDRVLIHAPA